MPLFNQLLSSALIWVNGSVPVSAFNTGATTAYVATDESTTSTSYTGLTTALAVTATIGSNGLALVTISAGLYNVTDVKRMSVAVSGATTVASSDTFSIRNDATAFNGTQSETYLFTGLTAGSNTFTTQYKTNSGTAHFFERRITVVPL